MQPVSLGACGAGCKLVNFGKISISSNMLVKFMLLCLRFIVLTRCHLVEKAIEASKAESALPDLFPQQVERNDLPGKDPETFNEHLQLIFRRTFFFPSDYPSPYIDLGCLTPEERLLIKKNWMKNGKEVISIDNGSTELSAIQIDLSHRWLKFAASTEQRSHLPAGSLPKTIRALQDINNMIRILKVFKYLRLAEIDARAINRKFVQHSISEAAQRLANSDLSSALVQEATQDAGINFGNLIVLELERLIHSQKLFFEDPSVYDTDITDHFDMWSEAAFKTLDFVFKHGFVSGDTIRSFFQSPENIKQLFYYVDHHFHLKFGQCPMFWSSPYLTKHWYWNRLQDCFQALTAREESLINAYLLLESRHGKMLALQAEHEPPYPPLWNHFFDAFERNDYLLFLEAMQKPESYHTLFKAIDVLNMANKQVGKIINLITTQLDGIPHQINSDLPDSGLANHLYYILDFIETHVSPGIINEVANKNPHHDKFYNVFNLIELNANLEDLEWQFENFYGFVKMKSPPDWSTSDLKPEFDRIFIEARYLLLKCQTEASKFPENENETSMGISAQFREIRQRSQNLVHSLEKIITVSN